MTDAHFMALLVIATWLYARAIALDGIDGRLIVAGSGVAALAFLTRQQGALIIPAVATYLLVARRVQFDRASLVLLVQLVTLPAVAIAGYYTWLRYGNDVPTVQTSFFREAIEEGWSGTWWLVQRLTVVELMYLGFFTLPLVVAVLPRLTRLTKGIPILGLAALCTLAGNSPRRGDRSLGRGRAHAVRPAVVWFRGARRARRPRLTPDPAQSDDPVSAHHCLSDRLLLLALWPRGPWQLPGHSRALTGGARPQHRAGAGAGSHAPSYHYIGWAAGSLDRYPLPSCPSRSRWRSGPYAACGSPFHWDGSSSRCWRSSRSPGTRLSRLHARGLGHG